MLESQISCLREAVRLVRAVGTGEVRAEAMREYNDRLQERLRTTVSAGGCRSWYLDANGRNTQNWPGTTIEFRRRTRRMGLEDHLVAPVTVAA